MRRNQGRNMQWILCAVIPLTLAMFSSHLWALNSETNRATLRGLTGVRVLVEDLPPEAEREGLSKNQLEENVELKLGTVGIRTFTDEECRTTPGEPYLYININLSTLKTERDIYSYSIDIGLIQDVTLQRSPAQTTYAITWSTGGVGLISKKQLSELQESVEDLVAIFLKAFFSVNPKK